MMTTMTPRIYFATPLEQTYSFYLAQQVFGVVLPISGSIRLEIYLNISGRNAVQFLTQSNVDRSILRALWTVADPSNVGSLTDLYQFQLLLRLVSLAQAGSILPPPSPQQHQQQPGGDDDHLSLERLRALVQQTAHQQLNLPTFANVMVPSSEQLTLMYGYLVENPAAAVPVGGSTPLPLPPLQTQSIEDAFGGLVEVEDAPLGGLVDVATAAATAAAVINEPGVPMEDDFGGFEQAIPSVEATLQQDVPFETGAFTNNFMDDAAASADGGGNVPRHVPRISQMSGVSGLSDAFSSGDIMADGNVEATVPGTIPGTMTSPTEAISNLGSTPKTTPLPAAAINAGGDDDKDDDFGGFESATPSATGPVSETLEDVVETNRNDIDNNNAAAFGAAAMSTSTAATGIMETAANTVTTTTTTTHMDIADAFGDVAGAVQDVSLPALDTFSSNVSAIATVPQDLTGDFVDAAPATVTASDDDRNEDDEVGDFGSATQPSTEIGSLSNNFAGAPISGDDEFGGFGSAAQPTSSIGSSSNNDAGSTTLVVQPFVTDASRSASEPIQLSVFDTANDGHSSSVPSVTSAGRSLSVADAFGDIAPAQDAPLPSLDSMGIGSRGGDDGGGDGTAVDNITTLPQEDNLGAAEDEDDDFGGFKEATPPDAAGVLFSDASQASLAQHTQPEPYLFGVASVDSSSYKGPSIADLGRAMPEPVGTSSLPSVTETGRSVSISDAFGDIPESQDAPLPSLDSFGGAVSENVEGHSNTEVAIAVQEEDEDFGDFDSADPTSVVTDATHSVAEQQPEMTVTMSEKGPFLSTSDAFGSNLPEIQDVPLPDLGSFGASLAPISPEGTNGVAEIDMHDDDFGGFEAAPTSVDEEHDVFGGFEAAAPAQVQLEEPALLGIDAPNAPAVTDLGRSASEPQSLVAPSSFATETERSMSLSDAFGATATEQGDIFGDFTSTQANAPAENQDEFAAFESAPAAADQKANLLGNTLPTQDQQQDELFGDFTSTHSESNDSGIINEGRLEADSFAAFESNASATNVRDFTVDPQTTSTYAGDAVGTLNSAPSAPTRSVEQSDQIEPSGADQGSAFAAFESSTPSVAAEDTTRTAPLQNDADLFGDFCDSVNKATSPTETAEDGFNAFESTTSHAPATKMPASNSAPQEDKEFGNILAFEKAAPAEPTAAKAEDDVFGSFSAPATKDNNGVPGTTENNESDSPFGNFTQFQSGEQPIFALNDVGTQQTADDDFGEFGDFGQSVPAQTKEATISMTKVPSGSGEGEDDWGDFENVSAPSTEVKEPAEVLEFRDRIKSLSLQLPESLLRKSGFSGEHVDLCEVFEANIGVELSLDKASRDRVERCIQVLRSVSQDHRKLASSYWIQIFDVIYEELEVAKEVLLEVGALSAAELKQIMGTLRTMLVGLAEYMRISRSIVATIGDVLLLDTAAMLTIDTWASTWCSLSILEPALEVEKQWKAIHKLLLPELKSDLKAAVTLQEIRLGTTGAADRKVCHLTLQPLWDHEKATTRAEVAWQGQAFMACSANFLANRCPFFVVED